MALAPFPIDPHQTALAILYRNPRYIADLVLPRVPVATKNYKFTTYPITEQFKLPVTQVGRRGRPNEVQMGASEATGSCNDYALDWSVPRDDITQAAASGVAYNPVDAHITRTSELLALAREVRTAALVFAAASYPTGYKQVLSGTSQFSDFVNSDPIGVIAAALDVPMMRPNVMVIGQAAWSPLSRHPKILKAIRGNDGGEGIAKPADVARLFELDEVLVGESRRDTAVLGQTESLARVWGKHIALHYRDITAAQTGGITWGMTAEFGTRIAGSWEDRDIGVRGGLRGRVGESVEEKRVADAAGYFIENAVA